MSKTKSTEQETWTPLPKPVDQTPYDIGSNEYEWSDEDAEEKEKKKKYETPEHLWYTLVLRFGKYKGMTLRQMVKKARTRKYLRWLLKTATNLYADQVACIHMALNYHAQEKAKKEAFKLIKGLESSQKIKIDNE